MYYLRSRYYHAEQCRFLNIDSVGGRNLFTYCLNSPISQIDANGTSSNYATMVEMGKLHEAVVSAVAARTGGFTKRDITGIAGAGRGGGWGYPDVVSGPFAWEVKPLTPYGLTSGRKQITRYTNNTGYEPGYPLLISPFRYEMAGKKGTVYVTNGIRAFGDQGVVYYKFVPDPDKPQEQTSPVTVTEPQEQESYNNATNFSFAPSEELVYAAGATLAVAAVAAVVIFTPIDELVGVMMLLGLAG